MPERPGPFSVIEIAQKLARQPGRMEFDRDEAIRVAKDMFEAFERGDIGSEEVVAQFGDPPRWGTIAEAEKEARRQSMEWAPIDLTLWYKLLWLTRTAVKRYLEASTLAGAPRLLREWFPDPPAEAAATAPDTAETSMPGNADPPRNGRRKPGPRPELRASLSEKMLDDLRSGRRTPEELSDDTLDTLVAAYGGSRNTADAARKDALQQFSEFQNYVQN